VTTEHIHIHLEGDCRLTKVIESIQRLEQQMSNFESQLDDLLNALASKLEAPKTSVDALIASIPPGVDLTDEIASVQAALGETQAVTDEVTAATPPPPAA
jgi:hypothetical protein